MKLSSLRSPILNNNPNDVMRLNWMAGYWVVVLEDGDSGCDGCVGNSGLTEGVKEGMW